MAQTSLVTADLTNGSELVQALDQSSLSIKVALWLHTAEYEDWRFVLASPSLDAAKPAEAYGLIHDALEASGIGLNRTPTLLILRMSDPFIRELRRTFAKTKSVEGMRLGAQSIGGRFVENAVTYRIR